MKPDIHPEYRPVVFQDQSSGDNIIIGSTIQTGETISLEGVEYPLAKVELSSRSHPFFTGQMKIVDTAGRVERFERRYGSRRKKSAAPAEDAAAEKADAPPAEEAAPKDAAPVEEAAAPEEAAADAAPEGEDS